MKTYFPKFDQLLNNFFIKYKIGNVQRTPEGNPGFILVIDERIRIGMFCVIQCLGRF